MRNIRIMNSALVNFISLSKSAMRKIGPMKEYGRSFRAGIVANCDPTNVVKLITLSKERKDGGEGVDEWWTVKGKSGRGEG